MQNNEIVDSTLHTSEVATNSTQIEQTLTQQNVASDLKEQSVISNLDQHQHQPQTQSNGNELSTIVNDVSNQKAQDLDQKLHPQTITIDSNDSEKNQQNQMTNNIIDQNNQSKSIEITDLEHNEKSTSISNAVDQQQSKLNSENQETSITNTSNDQTTMTEKSNGIILNNENNNVEKKKQNDGKKKRNKRDEKKKKKKERKKKQK